MTGSPSSGVLLNDSSAPGAVSVWHIAFLAGVVGVGPLTAVRSKARLKQGRRAFVESIPAVADTAELQTGDWPLAMSYAKASLATKVITGRVHQKGECTLCAGLSVSCCLR